MTDTASVLMNDLSVMIGMPTHRDIPAQTVGSLIQTVHRCNKLDIPLTVSMVLSGVVVNGRNDTLDEFLKSDCNRLFWIDSDMVWTPEQFVRLLALSKLRPVVGASYTAKIDQPTFFVKMEDGPKRDDLGLISVTGMGLGFTVITREVAEKLAANADVVEDEISSRKLANVFRWDTIDGKRRGEDMAFFHDIIEMGYDVMLDPDTHLGHVGTKEYRGKITDSGDFK